MLNRNENLVLAMKDNLPNVCSEDLSAALRRIFSTSDGHILWAHLRKTILDTAQTPSALNNDAVGDMNFALHYMNGKRALVVHLKNLALRGDNNE